MPTTILLVICITLASSLCVSKGESSIRGRRGRETKSTNTPADVDDPNLFPGRRLGTVPDSEWRAAYDRLANVKDWTHHVIFRNILGWDMGHDDLTVEFNRDTRACYIYAKDSDDTADWINNLFGWGSEEIAGSFYAREERYEHCWWTWSWIPRRQCEMRTRMVNVKDKGYAGFVGPYNLIAESFGQLVRGVCAAATEYNYIGFSRGGALIQIAAMHHFRAGIITSSDSVKMYLYNSPNALETWSANALKDVLDVSVNIQRTGLRMSRLVIGGQLIEQPEKLYDIVTSLPTAYSKPTTLQEEFCRGADNEKFVHICSGRADIPDSWKN